MSKIIGGDAASMQQQAQLAEMARLLKSAKTIKCDKCGNDNFLLVYRIKLLSGLATGKGRDVIVPIAIYACSDCGHVNSELKAHLHEEDEEETSSEMQNESDEPSKIITSE